MSTINELVNYLNPKKHKWINKARGAYHLYRIDAKFLEENQDINSTKVTKLVKDSLPGKRVFNDDFIRIDALGLKLFVVLEQGVVSYYFQRIQQGIITYISLEDLMLPGFDESLYQPYDGLNFIEINLQFIHFYHRTQGQIYSVAILHESVSMIHRKTLKYNSKELGGLANGEHFLDYKNAFGNTNSFWDQAIGNLEIDVGNQTVRTVHLFLNDQLGELYWYPKITVGQQGIILEYNYHPLKNDHIDEGVIRQPVISLRFPYHEGFLAFMKLTYFNNGVAAFDVWEGSMMRKTDCFKAYTEIVLKLLKDVNSSIIQSLRYLYFIPAEFFIKKQTLYKKLNNGTNVLGEEFLWLILNRALHELLITNTYVNTEDIVFKLLEMLNLVQENEYFQFKEKNDYLLHQLLTRTVKEEVEQEQTNNDDKKIFKYSSYLIFLYNSMHTSNFTKYNYFIYKLWKNSSYINPLHPVYEASYITKRTDKEEKDKRKPPLMLPYTTNEIVGFYSSSINSEFNENEHIVLTPDNATWDNVVKFFSILNPDAGEAAENLAEEDWKVTYHPLFPIRLPNPTTKKAIALQPISPALLVKANEDRSFWSNVGTAAEYAVDAITTLTGIGNLAKFRHLARAASLFSKTKQVYIGIRIAHAYTEISIGTINALLKITGLNKTEFGKALGDFLFWMEMLTLSVDITDAIAAGLRSSAKKLTTKYVDDLSKQLDELVKKGELSKAEKAKVVDELKVIGGHAKGRSIVATSDPVKVKAFEESFEKLNKLWATGKLTGKNAIDYLEDAMPYFNHKVVDGKVVQIDYTNCGNTVKVLDDFLKTGKIDRATESTYQSLETVAAKFKAGRFTDVGNKIKALIRLNDNPVLIKDGESFILYGVFNKRKVTGRYGNVDYDMFGHYMYGIKRNKTIHLYDPQTGEFAKFNTEEGSKFMNLLVNKGRRAIYTEGYQYLRIE